MKADAPFDYVTPLSVRITNPPPSGAKFTAPALPERIPSLNGLRAVSILLVLGGHLSQGIPAHLGNFGVRVFFMISGFLITTLLLKEQQQRGGISLKNFYMRRILRIFPAFYAYMGVVFVLAYFGVIHLWPRDMLHALTYTMNYHMLRSWYVNHTWSLSVEEQFYVLWPVVLVYAGLRRGFRIVILTVLTVPVIRLVMYFAFSASATALDRNFQAVCDVLAAGCLLAGVYNDLGSNAFYRTIQSWRAYVLIPLGLIAMAGITFRINDAFYYIIGQSVGTLGGILFLDYAVRVPESVLGKILNWAPLGLIGVWSYSIYLWQEMFIGQSNIRVPMNLVYMAAASLASYYLIERPFLGLRKWFRGRTAKPDAISESQVIPLSVLKRS